MTFSQYFGTLPRLYFITTTDYMLAPNNVYSISGLNEAILPDIPGTNGEWFLLVNFAVPTDIPDEFPDYERAGVFENISAYPSPKVKILNDQSPKIRDPDETKIQSQGTGFFDEIRITYGTMTMFVKKQEYWDFYQFELAVIKDDQLNEIAQVITNYDLQISLLRNPINKNSADISEIQQEILEQLYFDPNKNFPVKNTILNNAGFINDIVRNRVIPKGEEFPENPTQELFIINSDANHEPGLYTLIGNCWVKS